MSDKNLQEIVAYKVAVVTISDKGSRGERIDESGPIICKMMEENGYSVEEKHMVSDDQEGIEELLIELSDCKMIPLVLTTGGTGFSVRDRAPEATMAVAERNAPGIAEAMRAESMKITSRAMLSRAASVIRGGTLIINLPGSPKAAKENLESILPSLRHGLDILTGSAAECATK